VLLSSFCLADSLTILGMPEASPPKCRANVRTRRFRFPADAGSFLEGECLSPFPYSEKTIESADEYIYGRIFPSEKRRWDNATCKKCGSGRTVKSGVMAGKQRFLWKECGCNFREGDACANETVAAQKALCILLYTMAK
jgi:hypothetical protein